MEHISIPVFRTFTRVLRDAGAFALDTIAPPDPEIRRIERMRFAEFADEAQSCLEFNPLATRDGVISLCSYKTRVIRAALVEIKDRPNKKLVDLLGELLYEGLRPMLSDEKKIILPIPITKKKKRMRGWNQCELMLEGFRRAAARAHDDRIEICFDALKKVRENEDQVGKSRSERFENLKGCFGIADPSPLHDKGVIIFDDICTTGATFAEARRAVEAARPKSVICVSIAR